MVIDENLRSIRQNAETDGASPLLQPDHSISRHIRRKTEASANETEATTTSTPLLDGTSNEDQIQYNNVSEAIVNFLKTTSCEEVANIITSTQGTGTRTLYDALLQYITASDQHKNNNKPMTYPPSGSTNNEFSKARALSVPK